MRPSLARKPSAFSKEMAQGIPDARCGDLPVGLIFRGIGRDAEATAPPEI